MANPLYGNIYDNFGCKWIFGRRSVGRAAVSSGPLSGRGRSGRLSQSDKSQLSRIISNAPQAFVKITSRTYNASSLANTLNYIGRDGDLELETRDGPVRDSEELAALQDDWVMHAKDYDRNGLSARASISTHMVLSMPPKTDRTQFKAAVRDFVKEEFDPRHDYALAFHDDTDHPHAHLVVLTRDDEGKSLEIGRVNLDRWREQFAEKLRGRGIEADASPRHARGQFEKTPRSADYHSLRKGIMPQNRRDEVTAVRQSLWNKAKPERQWDQAMAVRRAAIGATYQAAAEELRQSADPQDRHLGDRLSAFEKAMPRALTRHQRVVLNVAKSQLRAIQEVERPLAATQNRGAEKQSDAER
ncbi:relaxase/mobilization nuclease domain-containing protein [Neorhizobium sp. T786]|uniref:relaxase/mobilization nuclease domain-containing protein n=1 Tax=Pseudorhizobium xiangyangii TaxID=2883104 RepID=UPI001CFF6AB1|nr:relaxase/mobilization nuclease domain-containing protein [Neorhizobium xiangyangii]MCB5205178.1 relaxase/mobilization nuclease domain-containing protein [Neorhizobium xiangyangii]